MIKIKHYLVLIVGLLIAAQASGSSKTTDSALGAFEFEKSCSSCHGFDGKGKGYMADSLRTPPADLTALSKNNAGHFPFTLVYRVIEGSPKVGVHGSREMPVWGKEYRKQADSLNADKHVYTRGIIMELILHIYSIQEN